MKNKVKRIMCLIIFIVFAMLISEPVKVEAFCNAKCEIEDTVAPQVDVIETKYRSFGGKIQYRRWNKTQGKWVDSHWIDVVT